MTRTSAEKMLTGLAGEYLTAARLCMMGYMAALTFKSFPGVDILAYSPTDGRCIALQVKTMSKAGSINLGKYPIPNDKLKDKRITVWVHVTDSTKGEADFYVSTFGQAASIAQRGHERWYKEKPETRTLEGNMVNITNPGVDLGRFKDNWKLLERATE
ncbi:MAG: hypothetical protein QUS33_10320 [Dehalococcoidia bacterium]|nr:hypothetical protein [Dehalococcoidia bacterium]